MSNSLGEAVLDITARLDNLEAQLDKSKKVTENKIEGMQKAFSAILSSAILAAIVKAYQQVTAAAEESLVTEAKVAAVIRATGNAAGYTVSQMSKMADEFSRMTGVDDELILNGEAVLLTFRKIGREVFPEATQAALDMSAVMEQDLQSSIVQIGKALNDPIAGISALSRVGVTFTDDQKKMITSFMAANDIIGAQNVILEELQAEFGGAAQAMEEVTAGGNRVKNSWENLQEALGEAMIPAQRQWNLGLAETLDNLTELTLASNEHAEAISQVRENYEMTFDQLRRARASSAEFNTEFEKSVQDIQKWTQYGRAWEERLAAEAAGVDTLGGTLEELDFKSLLGLTMSLSSETAKFTDQQEGVRLKQAEIKEEIDDLIAAGWNPLSEKVADLQEKYTDLGLEYDQNAIKHKAATDKILFDLFVQKISIEGISDAEWQMALKMGESTGVIDAESAKQAMAFDQVTQAVVDGRIAVEDTQRILDLMSKGYTIGVAITISGMSQLHEARSIVNSAGQLSYGGGRASGGDVFNDQFYVVGEDGPELFFPGMDGQIMPNISNYATAAPAIASGNGGMALSGGGGGMNMQFVYQPFIGVNDEYEAKNKMRDIVNAVIRENKK